MGPLLWKRQAPADAMDRAAAVPDYRVIQDDHGNISLESESLMAETPQCRLAPFLTNCLMFRNPRRQ